MLGTAGAAALVAGGAGAPPDADTVALRVLRAFIWRGDRQPPDTILPAVPLRDAQQLVAWGKAAIVPPAPPAPPSPPARPASQTRKDPAA